MKKKRLATLLLTTLLVGEILSIQSKAAPYRHNCLRVSNEYIATVSKEKFDEFWTPENEGFLSSEEKENLSLLKAKIQEGEALSYEDKTILKNLKIQVIRAKLGEEKFIELEKLIKKRESSVELTLPERARLYELDKEISGK